MDSLVPPTQENFERIAQVQAKKEQQHKRLAQAHRRSSSSGTMARKETDQDAAARVIQKTFRGYQARREMNGFGLNAGSRWLTAVRDAQFREANQPRARAETSLSGGEVPEQDDGRPQSARNKWKKASMVARHAGHDDTDSDSDSDLESGDSPDDAEERAAWKEKRRNDKAVRKQAARMMGLQYFLEMVDVKHRYGSNLRSYHEEWKKADTKENFFYWLDYGEGRYMELDACPRERLEREQVRYLSRDERQYYLAKVDADGRLCWAKNNARIDTTEQFKDSIHGIVPADDPTPAFNPNNPPLNDDHDDSSSDSSLESRMEADRAAKYASPGFDEAAGLKKVTHVSASTIFNKLLRKSVRKNTWIFVADTSFRLYVGIKDSGAFQHSSFLQGSRISAAGLIKVKNGRLTSLSPLSGHYRPPAANFRAFLKSLKAEGVDMRHLTVSKSYAVLVGLETYINTHKKSKHFVEKLLGQSKKIAAPQKAKRDDEKAMDKSQSAQKEREVFEAERQQRDDRAKNHMENAMAAMKYLNVSNEA